MGRVKGCFKVGCLGCAGVAGLCLLVSVVIGLGAVIQDRDPQPEQRELVQAVPRVELPATDPSQATTDDVRQPLFRFDHVDARQAGSVDLRLSAGRFRVRPGPAGEPIRVEGDYDASRYTLEQHYEPAAGGRGWVYKVRFKSKGLFRLIRMQGSDAPHVTVILPRDIPFALTGNISMGESEVELGGLWLTSVDLKTGMGEHDVSFGEPLAMPIESLAVDGSMGALGVVRLGNASPRTARVKLSMGELKLDLRGPWARDVDLLVRTSMGESDIRLPEGVNIDVERASVGLGERRFVGARDRPEIPGAPTVRLDASHSMGELTIR